MIVMLMADVRIIIHLDHHLDNRNVIEREPGGVIGIAVHAVAVKVCVIFNEEILDTLIDIGVDVCFFIDKTTMNVDMIEILHPLIVFFLDGLKHWHHDSNFELTRIQSLWQRVNDICQAACLDKRQ